MDSSATDVSSGADVRYVPLHVHSYYSIDDGLPGVEAIAKRAAALQLPAVAVTDLNNVAGFVRFYTTCLECGVKPILGVDLQVFEPEGQARQKNRFCLTVLAMDRQGKNNLFELMSKAWLDVNSPDIGDVACTLEDLAAHSEGLIVLNGWRGDLSAFIRNQNESGLMRRLEFYETHFKNRLCLEITRAGRAGEAEFEHAALDLCLAHGLPPVATGDTRFLYSSNEHADFGITDYFAHDVRVSIQRGIARGSAELAALYTEEQYLHSPQQMAELFADLPEALENTLRVAEMCNIADPLIIEIDKPRLPHYDTGELSSAEALTKMAKEGLEKRLEFLFPDPEERAAKREAYDKRLADELKVIIHMDFPGYFLIVQDFIVWSKQHGVPVGPGRGSGGGSLVAYALSITDFDPLRFDLLFERFLNPERVSMPDFDVDFCQRTRGKTIEYVKQHYDAISLANYGEISVSQIAAFGTLAPRAAIKGVGKAIGIPYGPVDQIAKQISDKPDTTFKTALGLGTDKKTGQPLVPTSPDFAETYRKAKVNDDRETLTLIEVAMRLEGVVRSISKHAAGVVISPTKLSDFSPLMLDSDRNPITQFDKKDVEHAGLVKFDFLGLTTLTIIEDAMVMIRKRLKREGKPLFEVQDIPYEDPRCFKMLQEGNTTAVFQLESTGMRKLIMSMRPDRFDDLVALVALYRPGPLDSGMVDSYVARKRGRQAVAYPDPNFEEPDLKPVLESTYGIIVYQEQVMQIAQILAGYTFGQADILRRAMGKKKPEVMAAQRSVFRKGVEALGRDPDKDMKIFDQVEEFAKYGFNKSHSAAYALVAWWTLWLKVYYPAEFLAAMMTADAANTDKLISYIAECRRLGGEVLPPDINSGEFHFGVDDKGRIVYGFSAIKGIGEHLVEHIQAEREANGPYTDLFDFATRNFCDESGRKLLNKKSLETLIAAGAFDSINPERARLSATIPTALRYAEQCDENKRTKQDDLFASLGMDTPLPDLADVPRWPDRKRLAQEKTLLGLYLSGHPIAPYRAEISHYCGRTTLASLRPGTVKHPADVIFGAILSDCSKRISSRDNAPFYVMRLDDGTTMGFEVRVFEPYASRLTEILDDYNGRWHKKRKTKGSGEDEFPPPLVLIVEGRYTLTPEGETRFYLRKISSLEELRRSEALHISISTSPALFKQCAGSISHLLDLSRPPQGSRGCSMSIRLGGTEMHLTKNSSQFLPSEELVDGVRQMLGSNSVSLWY